MEKAIDSYTNALNYQLADISTAATYQLGDIYRHFAQSLLSSDKPQGLSDDEIEQYDILMEEQAYLFEEKAIELHEANAHHIMDGLYNDWIKASLKALSDLYPIRYAKTEISEAFYDATQ